MGTYEPKQQGVPYGLHIPYDQGYDPQHNRAWKRAEDESPSGYLLAPGGDQISLWITDITADFSISGETGQSRLLREFYSRSFNDVAINVIGNVPSTYEYNRLASFVREHQWKALQAVNSGVITDQTITFGLYNSYASGRTWPRPPKGGIKGGHLPWTVSGYIPRMQAGAQRWEVAPEFNIQFIVTESQMTASTGLWEDTRDTPAYLSNILQIINVLKASDRVSGGAFVSDPLSVPPVTNQPPDKVSTTAVHQVGNDVAQSVAWTVQSAGKIFGMNW